MTNDVPTSAAPPPTASQVRVRATLESIFNAAIDLHCDVTGEALISLPDEPVHTVWPLRAPRVRFWLAERCWQETRDFARKSELDGMLNILAGSACRTPRRPVDSDELARLMDLHPLAQTIVRFMDLRREWHGLTSDLLTELLALPQDPLAAEPRSRGAPIWTRSASALGIQIRECLAILRELKICVEFAHTRHGNAIRLHRLGTAFGDSFGDSFAGQGVSSAALPPREEPMDFDGPAARHAPHATQLVPASHASVDFRAPVSEFTRAPSMPAVCDLPSTFAAPTSTPSTTASATPTAVDADSVLVEIRERAGGMAVAVPSLAPVRAAPPVPVSLPVPIRVAPPVAVSLPTPVRIPPPAPPASVSLPTPVRIPPPASPASVSLPTPVRVPSPAPPAPVTPSVPVSLPPSVRVPPPAPPVAVALPTPVRVPSPAPPSPVAAPVPATPPAPVAPPAPVSSPLPSRAQPTYDEREAERMDLVHLLSEAVYKSTGLRVQRNSHRRPSGLLRRDGSLPKSVHEDVVASQLTEHDLLGMTIHAFQKAIEKQEALEAKQARQAKRKAASLARGQA